MLAKTIAETLRTNPDKANRSTIAKTTASVTATAVTATKSSRLVRLLRDQALYLLGFGMFTQSHRRFSHVYRAHPRIAKFRGYLFAPYPDVRPNRTRRAMLDPCSRDTSSSWAACWWSPGSS